MELARTIHETSTASADLPDFSASARFLDLAVFQYGCARENFADTDKSSTSSLSRRSFMNNAG
jgi:hypothetical protein